jgi:hypothetical protein
MASFTFSTLAGQHAPGDGRRRRLSTRINPSAAERNDVAPVTAAATAADDSG